MIQHINAGHHVAAEHLFAFTNDIRMQFLNDMNINEYDDYACYFVLSESHLSFISEAVYGETLQFDVNVTLLHAKGFEMEFNILEERSQRQVALVKNSYICFDPKARRSMLLPEELRKKLSA